MQISSRAPRAFGLQPRDGERAVIVKDAAGDYAVAVGRWRVCRDGRDLQVASEWEQRGGGGTHFNSSILGRKANEEKKW